jgi:recombination protein RecR
MLPESLSFLAEKFQKFPGIGFKSSQKLALDVLQMSEEDFLELQRAIVEVKENVHFCPICGFFAEKDKNLCDICTNDRRKDNQICLVEKATDILTLEKSGIYSGKYHVLENLISPLENIFPENTTLANLIKDRIVDFEDEIELILFFKAGFAAETTTAYLRELIEQFKLGNKIKITRLAQGLPLYYNPDTLDQATMIKALEDRRPI